MKPTVHCPQKSKVKHFPANANFSSNKHKQYLLDHVRKREPVIWTNVHENLQLKTESVLYTLNPRLYC